MKGYRFTRIRPTTSALTAVTRPPWLMEHTPVDYSHLKGLIYRLCERFARGRRVDFNKWVVSSLVVVMMVSNLAYVGLV